MERVGLTCDGQGSARSIGSWDEFIGASQSITLPTDGILTSCSSLLIALPDALPDALPVEAAMLPCSASGRHTRQIAAQLRTHRMIGWPATSAQDLSQVKINGADAD